MGIGGEKLGQHLLQRLALPLGSLLGGLVDRVVKIEWKIA
jgi:hypothetical protein